MTFRKSAWRLAFGLAAAAPLFLSASGAWAQNSAANYPSKPIHIIVGFAAGGGNDIIARLVGQKMSEDFGQPVLVENKPGAGARLATELVARAPADGYTILVGASGAIVINPAVYSKLEYDSIRDFAPISRMASFPLFLVINPKQPIKTVSDLVAFAKANPKKANYGSPSAAFQLAVEQFKIKTGSPMEYVAYKSSTEAATAVMSGEVLMSISDAGPVSAHIKSGQLRALAVTAAKRDPSFPDVPTMAEAGLKDMDITLWSGLLAPAKTPPAIVKKLQEEVTRVVHMSDVQERFHSLAVDPVGDTSEQFRQVIATEIKQWTDVAHSANVKLE